MNVDDAIALVIWIPAWSGIAGLIWWLGRRKAGGEGVAAGPRVEQIEPSWTELMFGDGLHSCGRAYAVHDLLTELDAMARN